MPFYKRLHYLYWDLEGCTLQQAIEALREIHVKYGLGDIIIMSDREGSYRAWCFSKRHYLTMLKLDPLDKHSENIVNFEHYNRN